MATQRRLESVVEPGQQYEFDLFRPEDAEGVANLFLSVYGEGYPIRTFVEPQELIEENGAGRTLSSVARTPKGEIVGHNALFVSSPNPKIYESGAGAVHAAYRGGAGIFTGLILHGVQKVAPLYGVEAIHGEEVCNHVFTQKTALKLGWREFALEVDLMPAAAYVKERSAEGRVASLVNYRAVVSSGHDAYLPEQYVQQMRWLYERLDDPRTLFEEREGIPSDVATDIKPQIFDFAQIARLAVWETGRDFDARMERLEDELRARNIWLIQAWVNLNRPWVNRAVEVLRERGYFFGGLLPRWFDGDGMLMQKIAGRPSWEGIVIAFDHSARIVEMVRQDWERAMKG